MERELVSTLSLPNKNYSIRMKCLFKLIRNYCAQEVTEKDYRLTPLTHCWRMVHWYQHVSADPIGAGTNVHEPYKAGTLVPARNSSRH